MLTSPFHECSKLKHVCTPRPVLLRGGEKGEEVLFLTPPPPLRAISPRRPAHPLHPCGNCRS
jgi:hypothetical protein